MRIISGTARGIKLAVPPGKMVRPTTEMVREALFNIIGVKIDGSVFADMYAGSGSVGIEALSRGAKFCVFVEKNKQCVKIINENLIKSGLAARAGVYCGYVLSALKYMAKEGRVFDFIFQDPPYGMSLSTEIMDYVKENGLLKPGGFFILEHYKKNIVAPGDGWVISSQRNYGDTVLTLLAVQNKIN